MNKKRIAKEWLYFIGFVLFGLFVLPFLLTATFYFFATRSFTFSTELSYFYSALVDRHDALIFWLMVAGPYIFFQFIRSVIWAWKITRSL